MVLFGQDFSYFKAYGHVWVPSVSDSALLTNECNDARSVFQN